MGATLEKARSAKKAATSRLATAAGGLKVNGIGLARSEDGGWTVKVNLEAAPEGAKLPEEIGGVPVVYEVVGEVRARGSRRRG